tara:strand:+ start:757 stop:1533 length:777 start_codon:yes stop_codon:yes gene_type:complete
MEKIAVITSAIGSSHKLLAQNFSKNVDYHAFVDQEKLNEDSGWITHKVENIAVNEFYSDRLTAKQYKISPYKFLENYSYIIWIDSNIVLNYDPQTLVDNYLNGFEFAIIHHYKRNCLYDELKEAVIHKLDDYKKLEKQNKAYQSMGFLKNKGLYECNFILTKNTKSVIQLSNLWWEHITKFSSRDQISLPFVLSQLNIKVNTINVEDNNNQKLFSKTIQTPKSRIYTKQPATFFSMKIHLARRVSLIKKAITLWVAKF